MDSTIFDKIVKWDDAWFPLIALGLCYAMRKKLAPNEKLLIVYLFVSFVLAAVTDIMAEYRINNLVLYHFFTLFEQWFLTYYLIKIIVRGKVPGIYYYINTVFTIFWVINILFFESYDVFNTNTSVVTSLIVLLLCMYYLLDLSKNDDILYFQRLPAFWIVNGFLLYNALGILIFAVYSYYTAQYSIDSLEVPEVDYWVMMHLPIVLKYTMLIAGILCYNKIPVIKQRKLMMF